MKKREKGTLKKIDGFKIIMIVFIFIGAVIGAFIIAKVSETIPYFLMVCIVLSAAYIGFLIGLAVTLITACIIEKLKK